MELLYPLTVLVLMMYFEFNSHLTKINKTLDAILEHMKSSEESELDFNNELDEDEDDN
jgi:hypothetical protein